MVLPYKYTIEETLWSEVYLYHITKEYYEYLQALRNSGNGVAISGSSGKNITEMLPLGKGVFTAFQVSADTLFF